MLLLHSRHSSRLPWSIIHYSEIIHIIFSINNENYRRIVGLLSILIYRLLLTAKITKLLHLPSIDKDGNYMLEQTFNSNANINLGSSNSYLNNINNLIDNYTSSDSSDAERRRYLIPASNQDNLLLLVIN